MSYLVGALICVAAIIGLSRWAGSRSPGSLDYRIGRAIWCTFAVLALAVAGLVLFLRFCVQAITGQ